MADLIDRDELIEVMRKSHKYHAETARDFSLLCRDIRLVKEQPTFDAVQVVRCRDCKYFMEYAKDHKVLRVEGANGDCRLKLFHSEDIQFISCEYNDFCSYGERRIDETYRR